MPNDLISDDSWEKPEPGTRWFLPGDDRDACEPGPNSLMEYDMRQFVSYSECLDLVFNVCFLLNKFSSNLSQKGY